MKAELEGGGCCVLSSYWEEICQIQEQTLEEIGGEDSETLLLEA